MRGAFLILVALALVCPVSPSVRAAPAAEGASTRSLYLLLIRQARADGRSRAALAYLDDFERQFPADADARVLRVNCLLDLGEVTAAEAEAARLPVDAAGQAARGHVLTARGRWSEAAVRYRAALAVSPADPLVGNALGYALLRAGETVQALDALRSAADLAPGEPVIRNNLLLALMLAGRHAEADATMRKVPAVERDGLRDRIAREAARLAALAIVPERL